MRDLKMISFLALTLFNLAGCGGNGTTGDGGGGSGGDMGMAPQTCSDGKKDGDESDIDCGGACGPCSDGKGCGKAGDCQSAVCTGGTCAKASCTDGAKNGDETDVDCGGACPKCGGGKGCKVATDCATNMCNAGTGRCAAGPLTFDKAATYPVGKSPWGIVAVDVNNDKKLDLAISAADGVEILLGKGDGTFGPFSAYGAPRANDIPGEIASADFNKDGNADLVWPDFNNNVAYVVLGKGDGTFPAASTTKVSGGPQTAVVGDFDGDGRADVAMGLAIANAVAVMTGNGDGTFGAPASYPSGGTDANCVGALDLDGDGKQDLVVGNTGTDWRNGNVLMPGSVFALINDKTGKFKDAMKLFDAGQPLALVVGEFDGDAKADFAFTDTGKAKLTVSLNGATPTLYGAPKSPIGLAAADLNLDGKPDMVVSLSQTNLVQVFAGGAAGTFDTGTAFPLPYPNPGRVAVGDFNGDGKPDIAVINFNANMMPVQPIVNVLLNTTM